MKNQTSIVEFDQINDILGDDPASVKEFCEAAVISFDSFKDDFEKSMRSRELNNLKKAGHRIKPAAKMVGVMQLIDEYKSAKKLLKKEASRQEIEAAISRVQQICKQVVADFKQIASETNRVP